MNKKIQFAGTQISEIRSRATVFPNKMVKLYGETIHGGTHYNPRTWEAEAERLLQV